MKALRAEADTLRQRIDQPKVEEVLDNRMPSLLVSINGGLVKLSKLSDVSATGKVLIPLKSMDEAKPGTWKLVTYETPEGNRKVSDQEIAFLEQLRPEGGAILQLACSSPRATAASPELAGIRGALVGHGADAAVTLALCLPIGVLAADLPRRVRAQEPHRPTLIEVNINNLAAVPSIVFGLLGPGGVPELLRAAALGAACRRPRAGAARAADHHHRLARRAESRAAIDQGGGAGRRRLEAAGRSSIMSCRWPCPAS